MTTIAYRGGILAADTLVTGYETRLGEVEKIAQSRTGYMGGSTGDAGAAADFLRWVSDLMAFPGHQVPPVTTHDMDGLLITPHGAVYSWAGNIILYQLLLPEKTPFTAIGSGCRIAMGAMEARASAEQAVEIASKYDIYTGGRITTLKLPTPRPTRTDR